MVGLELRGLEDRVGDEAGKLGQVWVSQIEPLSVKVRGWGFFQATDSSASVCHNNTFKIDS